MSDSKKKLTEEELNLIKETKSLLDEVNSNPEVAGLTAPKGMKENVFEEIRAREAAKKEEEQEEARKAKEQELIRLGKIYKKKRKARKYWVLAAAIILALTFGMTSMGVPKKIFKRDKSNHLGREQTNVDAESDDIAPPSPVTEEEAYQKIEEEFGFTPVNLDYLPKDVELLNAIFYDAMQSVNLIYGKDGKVKIDFVIRPNYRTSSWGEDLEDELIEERTWERETEISGKKYLIDDKEERWTVRFEYKDVSYSLLIYDTFEEEVNQIVESLYFL